MPRTKPSDTIVYRIELGGKEREMVEEFLDSQKAANYAASGANIASSITGGFKDIVSPLTSLSATSGVVFGAILASISVYLLDIAGNSDEDNKNNDNQDNHNKVDNVHFLRFFLFTSYLCPAPFKKLSLSCWWIYYTTQ